MTTIFYYLCSWIRLVTYATLFDNLSDRIVKLKSYNWIGLVIYPCFWHNDFSFLTCMNALKEQEDMKAHSMSERAHSCVWLNTNLGAHTTERETLELEWSPSYGWKARHMDENETHLHIVKTWRKFSLKMTWMKMVSKMRKPMRRIEKE